MTVDPKAPPKIDFSLSPAGKPIKVELRDDEGRPVPNFYVTIPDWGPIRYPGSALLWGKADDYPKTDENGTFVWNEAPDLEIPLDFNDADWQNSKYMQIRGEKFIPRMEPYMFLVNPKLEISGKVVDAATGKPIPEFKMFWGYRDNPEYAAITWLSDKIQAGNDGVYSISETWPRYRYYVRIDADGYDPSVSRDIDINEGKQEIDFSLNKMSAENAAKLIRGTVLTPDGKPAAGADVAMLTLGRQPPFFDNGRIRGGEEPFVVKTDDKGAFQFAEVDFEQERRFPRNFSLGKSYDYILCFVHDTGFRRIKQDAMQEILKTGKPITLEKWGRLEGTLEVNATPGAGETVVFSDFQFLDGDRRDNSNPWAGFQYDGVITDARGRFAIERIPAGEGTAYRAFSKKRPGWNASAYTSGTPVMIRPGETTKIQIGGGWPVIGKLEFTAPNIDWSYANLRAYPGKEKPDATQERLKLLDLVPKNLRTVGDDRYAWMREMQKWMETTEDGKKYVRETTRLNDEESRFQKSAKSCLVAGDGTFRLDDMNSGDWLLEVELLAPPSMDRPYDNGKLLAHTQRHFRLLNAVPGGVSDVPFDLGMIRLKDGKGSKFDVGDIITVNADSTVYPDAKIAFPISCEIVSVNEDGTLAIRGEQEMEIGVVRRTVELNGTVRPEDIEPDNTVSGERVRNMTIKSNEEEVNNDRNGDLTATLPNGGTLSLRSLADPTSLENVTFDNPEQNEKMVLIPSWKPNGVTLPDHSFRRTRYSSISDTIRLDLKALKGTYFISYFPGLGGSTGSYEACNVYVSDWKEKDEIDFPVLFFPESETKKARPKENVHYLDDEQECLDNLCEGDNAFYCTKPKKNANKNVVFVQSEGESHAWEVYYAFRPGDWDSEKFQPLALDFAVFDREEREIPARTQGMAIMVKEDSFGNSLFLVNQTFFLKDAQAEPVEVRIERKAYYRVDFQNVSLKPGHLTKPTISVKAYPVEKQEAPQEKTNEALTAKLPNGGTLSLVSLSDPTQRKNDDLTLSWTPSGKMLTDMPFDAKRHDWSKSLLLLDLEAEKGRIAEICERGTYVVTSDGVYGLNLWDLDKLDEMDFLYLYFPDQEPKKPVPKENVHYLDNEEECLEHPFENYDTIYCTRLKRNAEKDTEFLKGEGKCEAWDISFPFRPEDLKSEKFQPVAWDFVLLDREGREIPPVSSYGPEIYVKKDALGNEIRLWNETFLLKVGQAESVEVRIERKPYYRVDFHNVSLKPGHLTKPTISVKAYPVD